jgi:hypothetical protein
MSYYFYSQNNRFIDMICFQLYYILNKHTSDRDSILRLHSTSWTVAVVDPLTRANIYGIITMHSALPVDEFL